MNAIQLSDAIDTILETFYEEVIESRGKEVQVSKKKAVAAMVALGVEKVVAKEKVQSAFEAIREQQRA